jgi:hypothetical protein
MKLRMMNITGVMLGKDCNTRRVFASKFLFLFIMFNVDMAIQVPYVRILFTTLIAGEFVFGRPLFGL